MKIRVEINEIEMKERIQIFNKSKRWFMEKIRKIDRPLAQLTEREKSRTQMNRIRIKQRNVKSEVKKFRML